MKTGRGSSVVKTVLTLFFIVTVLFPLGRMFAYLTTTDAGAVLSSPQFRAGLGNSLVVSGVSTLISVAIATLLAWCLVRTGIRGKGIFTTILTLPMLIPSISHGMGLILLFGGNGIITNLLHAKGSIYGFWGIVVGSVMYSFPVAFLMVADVMKYEDSVPYEAAEVLGIPKARQLSAITAPYLRKPMISVLFATFTMIITDYGVPLMVGGQYQTLPVVMYQEVIGLLDFGKGSVIGTVLLVPAVIAFLLDTLNSDKGSSSYASKPFELKQDVLKDGVAYASCTVISLFVLLPLISFALLSFVRKYPVDMTATLANVHKTMRMGGGRYLLNSILIALGTSCAGVIVSVLTAYCTARMPSKRSRLLHLVSITSLAIPGIVLGLSYILFFNGSFIYGTLAMLMLANMIHFFASPYLMMYNTFNKLNGNLEAVGTTLGIGRFLIVKDVLLPQAKGTILEMASYFFVNSMMTISAVAFLANTSTKPIALMINQFQAQMLLECSAFVSLLILTVNLVVKGLIFLMKRIPEWREERRRTC